MDPANSIAFEDGEAHLPDVVVNLVQAGRTTLAVWDDGSDFASTIRNYLLFLTPVLQYDDTIGLSVIPQVIIFIVFRNFPFVKPPQFNKQLNAKNRVMFLSVGTNMSRFQGTDEELSAVLYRYRNARFLWVNMLCERGCPVNVFALADRHGDKLHEITEEEGFKYFQEFKPRNPNIPNFHGQQVVVTLMNASIFSYLEPLYNGSSSPYSWIVDGIQPIQLAFALHRMNLSITYRASAEYGVALKNGTVTPGILKDVVEQVTDIATGHIFLRPELMGIIGFDNPWERLCVRYLVPRPVLLNSSSLVLVNVFHLNTYLIILMAILVTSAVATFISKFGQSPSHRHYKTFPRSLLGMVLQLAQVQHPNRSEYSRALMPLLLCWGWLGFLLTLMYNAELSATFTKPIFTEKIQTEPQFLQRGYTWGNCEYLKSEYLSNLGLFFDTSDPVVRKWAIGYCTNDEHDETNMRERLMRAGHHVILGMSYGKLFYYRENSGPAQEVVAKYEVADNCALQKAFAALFAPGSPYEEGVNLITSRLLSGGIFQKEIYDITMTRKRMRSQIPRNVFAFTREIHQDFGFSSVPQSVFYGPYIFLVIGWTISTFVFLYECRTFIRKNKGSRPK